MSSLTREPGPDATFLADVAGVLFDVDGVLRNASQAVPGAAEVIRTLNDRSVDYCLLTNNSTHSRASLLRELRGIGLEVMTNAAAARTFNVLASEGRRVVAGFILSAD